MDAFDAAAGVVVATDEAVVVKVFVVATVVEDVANGVVDVEDFNVPLRNRVPGFRVVSGSFAAGVVVATDEAVVVKVSVVATVVEDFAHGVVDVEGSDALLRNRVTGFRVVSGTFVTIFIFDS